MIFLIPPVFNYWKKRNVGKGSEALRWTGNDEEGISCMRILQQKNRNMIPFFKGRQMKSSDYVYRVSYNVKMEICIF